MTRVAESALSPEAAVERLRASSTEIRAAVLLDEDGGLAAQAGMEGGENERLEDLAGRLLQAAETAGGRAGVEEVSAVEVSRPGGGVFGLRAGNPEKPRRWTLVAVTAAGALTSLVLYDMRMALRAMGATG